MRVKVENDVFDVNKNRKGLGYCKLKLAMLQNIKRRFIVGANRLLIVLIETIFVHQGLLRYNLCPKQFQYSSCRRKLFPISYGVYK